MKDITSNSIYDVHYGMHYNSTSTLEDDVFFSLIPERNIPETFSPIIDEVNGLCSGYLNNILSDIYDVYDYNGYSVTRMELPLEHPWFDSLDFVFVGTLIFKATCQVRSRLHPGKSASL
ncbi:hypothetical protein ABFP30_003282 [Enterobacter bugandensis]